MLYCAEVSSVHASAPCDVRRAHLSISRLFNRERDDGLLDFRIDAVLDERLLPADLLQGEFAARFIEFFKR